MIWRLPPISRICLRCDGPKSYGAGKFCRACYRQNAIEDKWPGSDRELGYLEMEKRGWVYMKSGGWHLTEAGLVEFEFSKSPPEPK